MLVLVVAADVFPPGCGSSLARPHYRGYAHDETVCCLTSRGQRCGRESEWTGDACVSVTLGHGRECGVPVRDSVGVGEAAGFVLVADSQRFLEVSLGSRVACGRSVDGHVQCWGQHGGSLGRNTLIGDCTPTSVVGLPEGFDASSIGVGAGWACAASSNEVFCWGRTPFRRESLEPGAVQLAAVRMHGVQGGVLSAGGSSVCVSDDTRASCCADACSNWPEFVVSSRAVRSLGSGIVVVEDSGLSRCVGDCRSGFGVESDACEPADRTGVLGMACDGQRLCVIRRDELECFFLGKGHAASPYFAVRGAFRGVAVADGAVCALDAQGRPWCAGWAAPLVPASVVGVGP